MDEQSEQTVAAIETKTYRFDIERYEADNNGLGGGSWRVLGSLTGSWDYEVLQRHLAECGAPGTYRVIRYAGSYTDMAEFEASGRTVWDIQRLPAEDDDQVKS
jgi:hypothetical protein